MIQARSKEKQRQAQATWTAEHVQTNHETWSVYQKNLLSWLCFASWTKCSDCGTYYKRTLTEGELRDATKSMRRAVSQCKSCSGSLKNKVRCIDSKSFPSALRGLTEAQCRSLRPFSLHQGQPKQHTHGYKRRDALSTLSWEPQAIIAKIAMLPQEQQAAAKSAHECLLSMPGSAYKAWVQAHTEFLNREISKGTDFQTDVGKRQLRTSLGMILEPYMETALWPHLYPLKEFCESHQYANMDWKPFTKATKLDNATRQSAKAQFAAKLTSDIVDYGASYELLQFQFDRHVFRTILGSQKSDAQVDTDQSNEHRHWCPNYWKRHHSHLLDLVRQIGLPSLFLTIAPWEFDFPFPYWLRKMHEATGLGPTELAGPESLAIAHAVHEFVARYLAGSGPKPWTTNVFSIKQGNDDNVVAYVGRFEFQEGGKEHQYGKGRGSLHVHCLFWLKDLRAACVENEICAELTHSDAELATLAARQVGIGSESTELPIQEEPSRWEWSDVFKKWTLKVKHTSEFRASKLRPFLKTVLRVLRCHSDIQWWDSTGALLLYVVGYVSKYHEAWDNLALKEDTSAWGGALALLRGWHAAEAEMVMVLAREPMVFHNFTNKDYNPRFWGVPEDAEFHLYRRRSIEFKDISLLQWLRVHTVTGKLEDRTAVAKPRTHKGIVCVGVRYKKVTDDRFFWQWLLMNKPHRMFEELCPLAAELTSTHVRCFAKCLLVCPGTWDCDEWVKGYFTGEGHRGIHVHVMLSRIRALRRLVIGQIDGTIPRAAAGRVFQRCTGDLSPKQMQFLTLVLQDHEEREAQMQTVIVPGIQRSIQIRRARFLDGGPGSGKTFCVMKIVHMFIDKGLKVLYATPTGKLAVACVRRDGLLATTLHRAFGINAADSSTWRNDNVGDYDVWLIDEISMVHPKHFEHIMNAWISLDRLPILIFVGDFQQLPPIIKHGPLNDARSCQRWHSVLHHDLGGTTSFRTNDPSLLAFQTIVRHRKPEVQEVTEFFQDIHLGEHLTNDALTLLFHTLPEVIVLTATQAVAADVNNWAVHHFGEEDLGQIMAFPSNGAMEPTYLQLYRRTRVRLTKTIDFDNGLVNGAEGVVLDVSVAGVTIQMTDSAQIYTVWRTPRQQITSTGTCYYRSAFELSLAYATTVHQAEGQSLNQVCVVFESFCPPGWAYTALTRARSREGLRVIGAPLPSHFQPRKS